MATTYTSKLALRKPAAADRTWDVPVNENADLLEGFAPLSGLNVSLHETPSTTLNVAVAAGKFRSSTGTIVTYAGTSSQAMTTAATNYVYLTDGGTLTVNTSGYPSAWHVRLATVVAGATTITSITDDRIAFVAGGLNSNTIYLALAGGTLDDAANIAVGSTTGTKIATATSQKLGFFNATPIVQPANTVDIAAGLVNLGLRASGGNPAFNIGTGAVTCGTIAAGGSITIGDAFNIVVNTTTGTKIGTATTQKLGFYNATPIVQPSAYTQTYTTADKTFSAYTSDPESSSYTGIDNAQGATPYAQVSDLNSLRTAYETLRVFTEDLAALVNSIIDDLQALGIVG